MPSLLITKFSWHILDFKKYLLDGWNGWNQWFAGKWLTTSSSEEKGSSNLLISLVQILTDGWLQVSNMTSLNTELGRDVNNRPSWNRMSWLQHITGWNWVGQWVMPSGHIFWWQSYVVQLNKEKLGLRLLPTLFHMYYRYYIGIRKSRLLLPINVF